MPPGVNASIGIYEYVGERKKDCRHCLGVYILKGKEKVSLVRLYNKVDDYKVFPGWFGVVS